MTKLLDKICKIRDLMVSKDFSKLKFYNMQMGQLKEEVHRQIRKKATDYNYELDFTSQDLRELSSDIRKCLKRWETAMNPEKNIKALLASIEDKKINLDPFYNKTIPIMIARTENIQALIELLNLLEYHSVYLYMLEEASNDEFALKYTERLVKG